MANVISLIYPCADIANLSRTTVTSAFKVALSDLPMFESAYISETNDPLYYGWRAYESGTPYAYHIMLYLPYGNNYHYRIGTRLCPQNTEWAPTIGPYQTMYSGYRDTDNYRDAIRNIALYKVKSENTNGFWQVYPPSPDAYTIKTFVIKCIDEANNTEDEVPVFAVNYNYNNSNNRCWVYPHDSYEAEISSYKIANADIGFSNTFVMRQVRYQNYLFPNLYIISGGLFSTNKDIITIDNNTYVHMCNDIYVRL